MNRDRLLASQGENRITRRQFLEYSAMLGLTGLAAGSLASCGSVALASNQNNLVYWNLFGGGDGVRMVTMENSFQQKYPTINLQATTLAWGAPYYTKLAMAALGDSPPNVAIMHLSRLPTYADGGLLDPIDLNVLGQFGVTPNDFLPAVWQRAVYNGTVYAVPLDTHPFVMYYNTKVCQQAGLLDANGNLKPLQGPTELIDAFQRAKKVTGYLGLAVDTQDVTPWRMFYALYNQLGGKVLSPDAKELVIDEAKAEQALSFMRDLTITSKVASPTIDYGGAVAVFASGKAGFFWQGEWEITTFENVIPFSMVPFPNVFGNLKTQGDSHSFVIPRSADPSQASNPATYQFISYLLKDSLVWAQGGHVPAYLPVATSADYLKMKPQSNYAIDAQEAVLDPYAWFSGSGSDLENQAGAAFQQVLNGQLMPKQAIQQFSRAIRTFIAMPIPLPKPIS
jgi:multiple sugar transport system substrate-binding protein